MSKQIWYRKQAIARDTRLQQIDKDILPDSYVALYELTQMPDGLLNAIVELGILNKRTPYRTLRKIKTTGRVPVEFSAWVKPEKVREIQVWKKVLEEF